MLGRVSSAGIATSYRLGGPGSVFRFSQFFIPYVLLTSLRIYVFAFCTFCITLLILYYLCIIVYVLFIFYVTLPPGVGQIAVGNKYNNIIQFNSIYLCAKLNSHRPITKLAQVVQRR
jgi:hypothetical protein